ncbi:dTDP-4-dehydrorhamnose reductase [Algibacter agarivorans]|uniref:dTDP-4-dehydrorhamnose reductase n=1 Tax=Algibacter agarivorans TaxID=1109741 RepID=A0ABP9GFZ5_9FLAO
MINVLVTGSNGQLASCIKDIENQYSGLNFIYTDYLDLDICDLDQVSSFFKSNLEFHYCINCAAYTAVDKAEKEIQQAYSINAIGAKNLAKLCSENNTTLIHISTDFVFDGKSLLPYTEKDLETPLSVYGKSKLKGEEEIISTFNNYFILRTAWLYSEHGNNFMKTMLRLAETRNEISVVSDQIGTPTYAKDLAEVILKIIDSNNQNYGLFHYSNEGVASWFDFAKTIFQIFKIEIKTHAIKTSEYPTPAIRPAYSVLNKDKIKTTLKMETYNWQESLKKCMFNYKNLVK